MTGTQTQAVHTGEIWKPEEDNFADDAWYWRHPTWGTFYMEEESYSWILRDDREDGLGMEFRMKEDFQEGNENYDWETEAPPIPSPELVASCTDILERHESLRLEVARQFWNEWNGIGKRPSKRRKTDSGSSGCWWCNNIDAVKEDFDEQSMPKSAEDVAAITKLCTLIMIDSDRSGSFWRGYKFWFNFETGPIEEEHGLGVAFDHTDEIIGFHYSLDAC